MRRVHAGTTMRSGFNDPGYREDATRHYLTIVRRFFSKRVNPSDVDDMVQNVALKMESRASNEKIENIDSYVFQVARSVMMDQKRREHRGHYIHHQTLEECHHPIEELSPERIIEGRNDLEQVLMALENLPERTRQAFILHRFDHMPYSAIANHMGISVSAVEKHIMRAIRKLSSTFHND